MTERKRIYLCLAHISEAGLEQKYIQEAFDTNWVVLSRKQKLFTFIFSLLTEFILR